MPILCGEILRDCLGDPLIPVAEDTPETKRSHSGWTRSDFRCNLEFLTKLRKFK